MAARNPATAFEFLFGHNAHFVLVNENKRPCWRAWNKRRAPLDCVLHHAANDQPVAIIPASIHTSALDVDHGDIGELVTAYPPLADLPTKRGHHLYYDDDEGRGNAIWAGYGCAGELRSARGYLMFHDDGAARLAKAIATGPRGTRFPADLFELNAVRMPRQPQPVGAGRAVVVPLAAAGLSELETVREPGRNQALFDTVRFWAYAEPHGADLVAWIAKCETMTREQNGRFPEPLDAGEVAKVSYNIATWTWAGGGARDHSAPAQRRRALKGGEVRRGRERDRDAAIVHAKLIDWRSTDSIAAEYQLHPRTVRYIVNRDTPLFVRENRTVAKPWEAEGISRATWYRRRKQS